ncbi:NAD(P)/FAD-dependent oxidoreductase [Rhodococcus sp. X156]|uniref:NAD(P)/FAD-dependent oxidoreductase n=1 Tax=Rhodococcus sp. X156 TaxID=2499145 RepID=UPI000FD86B90|nr:NAD(P)/FAD-dependent oxidoreductase [Rhodococcus sp. X156]
MAEDTKHDVVIVGAGFAGIAAAERLSRAGVRVLLLDKNNYHQFQPLLYQVATAQISVADVARPLRGIFRGNKLVDVKTAEVASVNPTDRSVTTVDGMTYRGTILVLAAGAEANFFNTPGAKEHTFPLYSVDDAARLASRMLGALDSADSLPHMVDEGGLNVVVVGGGPTGVETAGAIAESIKYVVSEYFTPEFADICSVYLVDMIPTVLAPFTDKSQKYTKKKLAEIGVKLRLGVGVAEVAPDRVTLADGTVIPCRVVVWAGGLKAGELLTSSGLPQGKGGRIDVNPDLTAPGFDGVYVLGDAANITDAKGNHLPQLGSVAQQAGKWAAKNILADLAGRPREPFHYLDKGIMAMVGRGAAVAEVGVKRRQLQGPIAFAAWLGVHAVLLSGARERLGAFLSWGWDYFTHSRPQIVVYRPDAYASGWNETVQRPAPRGPGGGDAATTDAPSGDTPSKAAASGGDSRSAQA